MQNLISCHPKDVSMSSLDIAELVEKRHDNVKRTVETLSTKGVIQLPQFEEVKNHLGQTVTHYRFTGEPGKRDSYIVVAQLSPEFTAKLVDRWQELENKHPFTLPANYVEALEALVTSEKEKHLILEEKQQTDRALNRIAGSEGSLCITDAAKALGLRPQHLFSWLQGHTWIYHRLGGRNWIGYQSKIQQGLLTHKIDTVINNDGREKVIEQVRITPKGLTKLSHRILSTFTGETASCAFK